MSKTELIQAAIRTIPDYPKPGVLFRDITTLLGNAKAFRESVQQLAAQFHSSEITKVAGLEARGFILGGAIAVALDAGFVPVRKRGKLPFQTHAVSYELEYGSDQLEVHVDAILPAERVLLVDDLIATGGTARAALQLLKQLRAVVVGAAFVIDLPDLGGAATLRAAGVRVESLVSFAGH